MQNKEHCHGDLIFYSMLLLSQNNPWWHTYNKHFKCPKMSLGPSENVTSDIACFGC